MPVPTIKDSARMKREEAMRALMREGFNGLEAGMYLEEPDPATRKIIFDGVRKRQSGKGGTPLVF